MAYPRGAMCVLMLALVLVGSSEAAKIVTFLGKGCTGGSTYTFYVGGNSCQKFGGMGSVQISEISSNTRVSIHNQQNCETKSSVAQIYGPGCVNQGGTKLQAVYISG